ncbi:MAG: IS1595 family transposase [Candidatus Eisenbacteria bacterium]|nr:IS1595 family transposase [Candidatus Eisenbacteria bacterium]
MAGKLREVAFLLDGTNGGECHQLKKKNKEDQAIEMLEQSRWPNGPFCPFCGSTSAYRLNSDPASKTRKGLCKCRDCRKQFSVTVGTIFHGSKIPIHKWMTVLHLMTASKKGISALQISRMMGITYKSAWFMCHRVRHAMSEGPLSVKLRGVVEVDETYVGGKNKNRPISPRFREGAKKKIPVIALVQRGGNVRSFKIKNAGVKELRKAIEENVDRQSWLMTDQWKAYTPIGRGYQSHEAVNHSALEYVRGNVYTNTAESYFSLLKRGIIGTFHNISEKHLDRYNDEFAFRWNMRKSTDGERAMAALRAVEGKRLTYKAPTA